MGKMYKFEREVMEFDGIQYIVIRMKHALFKDQWKDRCKVYQIKNKNK